MASNKGGEEQGSRRPQDTAFKQQRLQAWQPVLTPRWVIGIFIIVGVVFTPVGTSLLKKSDSVVEYKVQYDGPSKEDVTSCSISEKNQGTQCQVSIEVDQHMARPVYVYYELTNFFQNHRRYVKSRSSDQLLGTVLGRSELTDCDPLKETDDGQILSPCGLIANSLFNDVISLESGASAMTHKDIAWRTDRDDRFDQPEGFVYKECSDSTSCTDCLGIQQDYSTCKNYTNAEGAEFKYWYPQDDITQYLYETYPEVVSPLEGVLSEHFMVWMRTAALPKFRKLYGKIDEDIHANTTLVFTISNNFHVTDFDGTKSLVISTVSALGGKNDIIGYGYVVVGAICLAIGFGFLVKHKLSPRKMATPKFLAQQPK